MLEFPMQTMPVSKRKSQKIEDVEGDLDLLGEHKTQTSQQPPSPDPTWTNIYDAICVNKQSLDLIIESNRIILSCLETNDKKVALLATEMNNIYSKIDTEMKSLSREMDIKLEAMKSDGIKTIVSKVDSIKTV